MSAVGVDVGGSKIGGVLVDATGAVLRRESATHQASGVEAVTAAITGVIRRLTDGPPDPAVPLGLSVAGWLDAARERVLLAANLGLRDIALPARLGTELGRRVTMANDGDCAALGEYRYGLGRGARMLAVLTLGTGVGGGLVRDGALLGGATGVAGELGHLPIDPAGLPCACGGVGCLETLASGSAVAAAARRLPGSEAAGVRAAAGAAPVGARHVVSAAVAGDRVARGLLDAAGSAVGRAIRLLVPVVDPDVVVLAGGFAVGAGDYLLAAARRTCHELLPLSAVRVTPKIVLSDVGDWSAALGAAAVAADAALFTALEGRPG